MQCSTVECMFTICTELITGHSGTRGPRIEPASSFCVSYENHSNT